MSDERLGRIEEALQTLVAGQAAMRVDIDALRTELRTSIDDVRTELRTSIDDVRTELRTSADDLGRQMRVLHEEALERMQALTYDPKPLRREFQTADAELREDLVQRIEPLEAFVRSETRRRRRPTPS